MQIIINLGSKEPDKRKIDYLLNIEETNFSIIYTISNNQTFTKIGSVVASKTTPYQQDDIYGLELYETKNIDETTTYLRVHNGWISIEHHKSTFSILYLFFITQIPIGSGGSTGSTYTNSTPLPVTHGGAKAGTTFINMSMQEMFDLILYPYQSPTFTMFNLRSITSPYEIGEEISINQIFDWNTSNDTNIQTNSIDISGYNLTTLYGLLNDDTEAVSFNSPITRNVVDGPGTRQWTIQGTNTNSVVFTRNTNIRWDYILYAGTSMNSILDETEIKALTDFNSIRNGINGTYNLSAGGYKYIAVAVDYSSPTRFYDPGTTFDVDMFSGYSNPETGSTQSWSYEIVNLTNVFGESRDYKLYRTTNKLGGTQLIQVI